jgi:hypothetical protein
MLANGGPGVGVGDGETDGKGDGDASAARTCPALNSMKIKSGAIGATRRNNGRTSITTPE